MQDKCCSLWGGEKFILAPMVRVNSAALRWTCIHFGADLVYSEELIAERASKCKRIENDVLNTVDFIRQDSRRGQESVPDVVNTSICFKILAPLFICNVICIIHPSHVLL